MAHANAQRGTLLGTLVTHTAASAGANSPVFTTYQGAGILVFINVTGITGTSPTLTVTLKGLIDEAGTNSYTILASAAITANGLTVLRVYPGLTAAANLVANDVMPGFCQISTAIGGTTPSVTATVSAYSVTAG
jgi:hypothetical protein